MCIAMHIMLAFSLKKGNVFSSFWQNKLFAFFISPNVPTFYSLKFVMKTLVRILKPWFVRILEPVWRAREEQAAYNINSPAFIAT